MGKKYIFLQLSANSYLCMGQAHLKSPVNRIYRSSIIFICSICRPLTPSEVKSWAESFEKLMQSISKSDISGLTDNWHEDSA